MEIIERYENRVIVEIYEYTSKLEEECHQEKMIINGFKPKRKWYAEGNSKTVIEYEKEWIEKIDGDKNEIEYGYKEIDEKELL